MLIIGAHEGNLRLECECCGAHAIRPSSLLFWAARCHVCGEIAEVRPPRSRISDSRPVRLQMQRAAASHQGTRGSLNF